MYNLVLTAQAQQDLEEMISYIACTLSNPTAATVLAEEVERCFHHLESNPLLFEKCRNKHLQSLGYRRAIIKKYVMVYRVEESTQRIYVLRFFYGARDYEKLI